ncbi:MAG: lipoate--protein ligase family protein [Gemmatimonadaceae bacterium]
MARDTALQARAARTGETVFSIYSWSHPTLSFGRNQPASGFYDVSRIRAAAIDVVRRPTGGRAIMHHREVTYSVTAPLEDAATLRATYSRINRILQTGLSQLGVSVEVALPSRRPPAPSVRPCFETPGEGELVAQGAKLVASAQWRDEGALLQHGSILVDDDQSSLPVFAVGTRSPSVSIPAPATLHSLLGRSPQAAEVANAMFGAVRSLEDADATELSEDEVRADALEYVPHFLNEDWTWRR